MTKQEKIKFFIGKTFSELTIISFLDSVFCGKNKVCIVKCSCSCGNIYNAKLKKLKSEETKSCGCLNKKRLTTHGLSRKNGIETEEYKTWRRIKNRCLNIKDPNYKYYGGRGIKVCEEWVTNYSKFLEDMGTKPSKDYSIERIDNNLGYSKENCKWATKIEQNKNTRKTLKFKYLGKTQCLKDWCTELNLKYNTIKKRILNKKMSFEDAIILPNKK